ncbi:enoyl-ACP reductase [Thermus thermophilus]|nr:enoyl-ACP reductase [Thermus thermophilus]
MLTVDLSGKKALVMGVTNQRSLGFAIAEKLKQAGAEVALSYQAERLRPEAEKLAEALGGALLFRADVTQDAELDALFAGVREAFGGLDYLVHAIAFAPREAMEGRYLDTRRQDWLLALEVSAYSLVAAAQRAEPLLREGGGIVTLTYYASEKVVPRYNVMAVAKAALEASVRYLAYELGPKGVRVNAISAGPVRTVAARSIPGFTKMYDRVAQTAPSGGTSPRRRWATSASSSSPPWRAASPGRWSTWTRATTSWGWSWKGSPPPLLPTGPRLAWRG